MLILRLWNYLRGYVIIMVEGYFLEKFINICTHRQLHLWGVRWKNNSKMTMAISIEGFKLLRPIAKKTRCRVHIVSKKGLPFILHRYKNRKAFVFGSLIFILVFMFMTSFVWDVTLTGNSKISSEVIMAKLADFGVKPGVIKYKVNPDNVIDNMMLEMHDLARISITLKGTRVRVEVAERVKPPDLVKRDVPCNIIATKDGVISSIVAKEGLELVKIGQTITRGQILITGVIENKNNKDAAPLMVHSIGTVKARTWYEASALVEQKHAEVKRTGLEKDMYSLVLFAKKFKLFHGKIPYNNAEHVEIRKKLSIGDNLVLPFEWIIDQYYEYEVIETDIDIDKAREAAANKALKLAKDQIPVGVEIVKKDVSIVQGESGINTATAIIECLEDIGVTQEIGGR